MGVDMGSQLSSGLHNEFSSLRDFINDSMWIWYFFQHVGDLRIYAEPGLGPWRSERVEMLGEKWCRFAGSISIVSLKALTAPTTRSHSEHVPTWKYALGLTPMNHRGSN